MARKLTPPTEQELRILFDDVDELTHELQGTSDTLNKTGCQLDGDAEELLRCLNSLARAASELTSTLWMARSLNENRAKLKALFEAREKGRTA